MDKIVGAILAGGKSSRMGKDKARLRTGNRTLLQHMGNILKNAGLETIYISHSDFIADDIPAHGPLSGIHAILNHVGKHHKHIIFVPIDMPMLTSELIKKLISAPDEAALVHFESHKIPFRLNTDKQWLKLAEDTLNKGEDVSLGTFQKNIPPCQITSPKTERDCFTNINTPEQWQEYTR